MNMYRAERVEVLICFTPRMKSVSFGFLIKVVGQSPSLMLIEK